LIENVFGVGRPLMRCAVPRGLTTDRADAVVCHNQVTSLIALISLSRSEIRLWVFREQVVLVTWRLLLLDASLSRSLLPGNLDRNIGIDGMRGIARSLTAGHILLLLLSMVEI